MKVIKKGKVISEWNVICQHCEVVLLIDTMDLYVTNSDPNKSNDEFRPIHAFCCPCCYLETIHILP